VKYKLTLSDNSFYIVDDDYKLSLFYMFMKRVITIKDYLENKQKYEKYYLLDKINSNLVKRTFIIEETNLDYPIGMRLKLAKNIQYNDLVMGVDNAPRRVKELHTGEDDMYEIEVAGETYTVNGGHILALVDKDTGEHLEMPVNVFMHMDEEFQSHWVMEKIENR